MRLVLLVCGWWRRGLLFGLLLVVAGGVCASAASAVECVSCSAWWHVTSGARPSRLQPGGVAVDEVQELTVTTVQGPGEGIAIELLVGKNSVGFFGTGADAVLGEPTAAGVQAALEGPAGYGAGNVAVEEVTTGVAGVVRLRVTTTFKNVAESVAPLEVSVLVGAGGASADVVTPHSFVGSQLVATVSNLGDGSARGEGCERVAKGAGKFKNSECTEVVGVGEEGEFERSAVRIRDVLPAGLVAVGVETSESKGVSGEPDCGVVEARLVTCVMEHAVAPYRQIEVRIDAKVQSVGSEAVNVVSVSGGGVPGASGSAPVVVGGVTPFGIEHYELNDEEAGGGLDRQAGSHPFQTLFSVGLTQSVGEFNAGLGKAEALPVALAKDLEFRLPPGLIGNPQPFARCPLAAFFHKPKPTCPQQSVIGVSMVTFDEPGILGLEKVTVPVYNLEPQRGEPARFGFLVTNESPVFVGSAVRAGSDYGVMGLVNNITQTAALISSETVFWGVPGVSEHDAQRGETCLEGSPECQTLSEVNPPPFFELPTSCTGPLSSSVIGDSWRNPVGSGELPTLSTIELPELEGCDALPFRPSIVVGPDGNAASSPTGLTVDVHNPQAESLNAQGLGEADVKDITVALPEGVAVNPSGGNGLEACSEGLVGFTGFQDFVAGDKSVTFTPRLPGSATAAAAGETTPFEPGVNFCANASKIATAKIVTPLLKSPLEGAVYLATQNENPFGSLIAMYIVAEDPVSGVLVKLAGQVRLTGSGQLISTFENSPQAPFEDAELHFFGGERAPLATPARCGSYTTNASFTPWSAQPGEAPVSASSTFAITSGPGGGACPGSSLAFNPSLTGGSTNVNAGAFSPFTGTFGRQDGEQNVSALQLRFPPGLSGILTHVALCPEAQANAGTCPAESLIGETSVSAGVGSDPVFVTGGKIYLTEKYRGAPFGISIAAPVKAGPFDLEHDTSNASQQPSCDCVVVRGRVEVNPYTAALTITTNSESEGYAIPHMIDGIPVQIKKVSFTTTRPDFQFNPTSCAKMSLTGTVSSVEGASKQIEVPYQVTNCKTLAFAPKFHITTAAKTSKQDGASLNVKLTYPTAPLGSQANIAKVKVDLPKQLPSRLTTLQKACLAAVFEANPGNCPPASIVGHAKAITPLLPVALEGPAYFVSHGNEAFPSLTMVLQGYGVTVDLVGSTFIHNGVTSSTFRAVPDQPVAIFELTLPQGPYSALAANANLCSAKLSMPTAFVAQNGVEIHTTTPIGVTGCNKKPSQTQLLAKALKACRAKHNHHNRLACEQKAHKTHKQHA